MKTDAIRKCIVGYGYVHIPNSSECVPTQLGREAEAEFTAMKAKLQNREDVLRAFGIAAMDEDTVLARGIVAVVKAALKDDE